MRVRLGEFKVDSGTDLYGKYVRASMGNFIDTYRQASSGRWYKNERTVRTLPGCSIRDDDALTDLNVYEGGGGPNARREADLNRKTMLCNIDILSEDELKELSEINERLRHRL